MLRKLVMLLTLAGAPLGSEDVSGDFSYYVMALSWSPSFCAVSDSEQCDTPRAWVLHGLWPQYEQGWPEYCRTNEPAPTRRQTAAMADIMGTGGLAWHQWRKHGSCTGLSATEYFATSREAFGAITLPDVFERLKEDVRLPASVVEEAFLEENPGLEPDMLTITCRDGLIREARLCLTRDLEPVICGADIRRDCSMDNALFPAMN